jgi:TRAP-type C4-dicarboxylate transport system permease large subunit
MATSWSVGEVFFNGIALGVLLVLYPFIFRWAGQEPDPFDERQVARRRNCRVLVFTVPGLILVQILRLVLDISKLH